MCPNVKTIHLKYVQFTVCKLHFSEADKNTLHTHTHSLTETCTSFGGYFPDEKGTDLAGICLWPFVLHLLLLERGHSIF